MKKLILTIAVCLATLSATAQKSAPQMADIFNGAYSYERISGVNPLNDGESFSQISQDGKRIVRKSFKTGTEIGVLFDAEKARNKKLERIEGYIFSPDESNILIQTETAPIYRRSFTAQYYIYNVKNNTLAPL